MAILLPEILRPMNKNPQLFRYLGQDDFFLDFLESLWSRLPHLCQWSIT